MVQCYEHKNHYNKKTVIYDILDISIVLNCVIHIISPYFYERERCVCVPMLPLHGHWQRVYTQHCVNL